MIAWRALAAIIIATLGASCGAQAPLTVQALEAQIDALNGKPVRVVGYLPGCGGYNCALFADARSFEREMHRKNGDAEVPSIGIGVGEDAAFDHKADALAGKMVIVTGKVTNHCRFQGKPVCLDRSTDLEPTDIQLWSEPGASTKTH